MRMKFFEAGRQMSSMWFNLFSPIPMTKSGYCVSVLFLFAVGVLQRIFYVAAFSIMTVPGAPQPCIAVLDLWSKLNMKWVITIPHHLAWETNDELWDFTFLFKLWDPTAHYSVF